MFYNFNGCNIYYEFHGERRVEVNLFLHGWGQNGDCFNDIIESIGGSWLTIDFPPFGRSQEPKNWNLFSYANMVISILEHLGIDRCNLFGHSFGGRIAILIASLRPNLVNKLMLIDSAGMKPKRKISYYFRVFTYKLLKIFGNYSKNVGSSDYNQLSNDMKKTFVSIVNTHLEEYCLQISALTTIVYGANDEETPIYMAKKMHKLIKNSTLHIIDGAGHFVFIDREIAFVEIINNFLKEK